MTDFGALRLSAPMLRALEENDFSTPTPIQAATIPALLEGQDVIGLAQTGSGKTAAFVLPMLERLCAHEERPKPGMPRALILAPTRELAKQITETVKMLSRHTKLRNLTIYGGAPYRTQIHILKRGVDILVATPGRLVDHMKQGNVYLDEVEYFVLDEADRMLDMGFVDEVRGISAGIRCPHQSVMFSATLGDAIRDLAQTLLNDPEHIEVARQATIADNLTHKILFTPFDKKYDLLLHMIEKEEPEKALIFVRTRREADTLADYLTAMGHNAQSIHGDKKQNERERIIRHFKGDRTQFLVATDVAARGIDVKDITHVFNIDVPIEAESYVHRIGRTARGGMSGKAFTFCSKSEFNLLRAIERMIKMEIETFENHPFPLRDEYNRKKKTGEKKPFGRKGAGAGKSKKTFGKKTVGKKTVGKKPAGKKPVGKKVGAKKPMAGKPGAKSAAKPAPRKTAAKATARPGKPRPAKRQRTEGGNAPLKRRR